MGCVGQTITDIRMLYTKGEDNKPWTWSDAGWGGDWLNVVDRSRNRLMPFAWKTAYEAHGPCLTGMRVRGCYRSGYGDQVSMFSQVRTLRTDDYARTFTSLQYTFNQDLSTAGSYFFSLGSRAYIDTPVVACGNRDGIIDEFDFSKKEVKPFEVAVDRKELTGPPPWFIAYP